MKPTAMLVNTARSGLVDEAGPGRGAYRAADHGRGPGRVRSSSRLPPDHPLLRLDNVTITPHLAGSTIDAFRNSPKLMAGHLRRMLWARARCRSSTASRRCCAER